MHDSSKDNRTVFVSNLDFSTEETTIRDIFQTCGKIADLRLVKDYKGRSKGYCYVEFESPVSHLNFICLLMRFIIHKVYFRVKLSKL